MSVWQRIHRLAMALGIVFLLAVFAHHTLTGGSWLDAVYFFVITVSGVGYSETSSASPEQQVLAIVIILFGMTAVGYAITLLLQMMVEGQIYRAMGVRRMTRDIEKLSQHIIICGYGHMGRTLVEEFQRRQVPFVVVDQNPELAVNSPLENVLALTGDALDEETLLAAGVKRAKTLIASLGTDADNVFLTLTARNLNRELRILARGEMPTTQKKLLQAGADQVVLPAVIGAHRMATLVTHPHAAAMMDLVSDHNVFDAELEELTLSERSPLVGQTVRGMNLRQKYQVMLVTIRRADGQMLFNPDPDISLQVGDTMILLGKLDDLRAFGEACQG